MQDAGGAVWVRGADELRALVGRDLGPSEWFEVTQEVVDAFGRAVADWHWAHNDPARAARGPLGGPIGHAHLTLSVVPHLRKSLVSFATGECMFYGYNRVRFPTAVPVGAPGPDAWDGGPGRRGRRCGAAHPRPPRRDRGPGPSGVCRAGDLAALRLRGARLTEPASL